MLFSAKSILATMTLVKGAMSFGDTSPHIFFSSTEELDKGLQKAQFSSFVLGSSEFTRVVGSAVSHCPVDSYIFIDQPSVNSYDLFTSSTPNLRHFFDNAASKYIFPHVSTSQEQSNQNSINENDSITSLTQEIVRKCSAEIVNVDTSSTSFVPSHDSTPKVYVLNFPALPSMKNKNLRNKVLEQNDNLLSMVIGSLQSPSYALVYTSSSGSALSGGSSAGKVNVKKHIQEIDGEDIILEEAVFEEFEEPLTQSFSKASENVDDDDDVEIEITYNNVFDRYQFFGAGIFESTIVAFLLISVFFTAYAWISNLQITYNAFEKAPQIPTASKAQ